MKYREESMVEWSLADTLTLSRLLMGPVIVALSYWGKDAYIVVVILSLSGAFTDILDGMAARRWLKNGESYLGQYDLEIDTLFIMSILAYLSFSHIVMPQFVGFGWIILCALVLIFYNRRRKVLLFFEIPAICGAIICAGLYDFQIFQKILLVIAAGVILNFKRIWHLITEDFPRSFSRVRE